MKTCEHEFENANCTNCANGLPCSEFECAKTKGTLKEYCHERAEEIHNKYYQQGRSDAIKEFAEWLGSRLATVDLFADQRAKLYADILAKMEQLKEQKNE